MHLMVGKNAKYDKDLHTGHNATFPTKSDKCSVRQNKSHLSKLYQILQKMQGPQNRV